MKSKRVQVWSKFAIHLGILFMLQPSASAEEISSAAMQEAPEPTDTQAVSEDGSQSASPALTVPSTNSTELQSTDDSRAKSQRLAGGQFEGFSALRHMLLEAIASAQTRVWLTTEFLSDGEIVTALYLAQYRKLDVKVLLGKRKAQSMLSRLNYLKQQKVPVWLRPDSFKAPTATALLVDNQLFWIDAELDSMSRAKIFEAKPATNENFQSYIRDFSSAAAQEIPAIGATLPMVGRAFSGGRTYDGSSNNHYNTVSKDGAYRYGRKPEPRPHGVSDKLPKRTKWQERGHSLTPQSESSRP